MSFVQLKWCGGAGGLLRWVIMINGIMLIAAIQAKPQTCQNEDLCMTKECILASARLFNNMNTAVDPCQDFYEFTCGGFIENQVSMHCSLSRPKVYQNNLPADWNRGKYTAIFPDIHRQKFFTGRLLRKDFRDTDTH